MKIGQKFKTHKMDYIEFDERRTCTRNVYLARRHFSAFGLFGSLHLVADSHSQGIKRTTNTTQIKLQNVEHFTFECFEGASKKKKKNYDMPNE